MAARCCHPILIWMINFLILITVIVLTLILLFTTFSLRPSSGEKKPGANISLTVAEDLAVAHVFFAMLAALFIHAAMKLVSTGGHRDYFYRIEKDFKILCALAVVSTLIVAILGIVLYMNKDTAVVFKEEPGASASAAGGTTTMNALDWFRGSTSEKPKKVVQKETKESNVQIYVLYLLIADIASLVLTIVGVVTIIGCNRRERYDVEQAVEEAMLLRSQSRSALSSRRSSRSRTYYHSSS